MHSDWEKTPTTKQQVSRQKNRPYLQKSGQISLCFFWGSYQGIYLPNPENYLKKITGFCRFCTV